MIVTDQHRLYGASWKGVIVDGAFAHPAKFSRRLIRWIYQHFTREGWLHPGDKVLDPFAGVALGALGALQAGCHWVGLELEAKFVALGQANIELWDARLGPRAHTWGTARLIQGDSRQLLAALAEADAAVSSPPYATGLGKVATYRDPDKIAAETAREIVAEKAAGSCYGVTPGQLGMMPEGDAQATISSPPYTDSLQGGEGPGARWDFISHSPGNAIKQTCDADYGGEPGQMAAMPEGDLQSAISSPPYADSLEHRGGIDPAQSTHAAGPHSQVRHDDTRYGETQGQLAQLPEGDVTAAISSPPFGAAETRDRTPYSPGCVADMMGRAYTQDRQGETEGNLAQLEADEEGLAAAISSPPFEDNVGSDDPDRRGGLYRDPKRRGDVNLTGTYGDSPGQLGHMAGGFDGAISSPPYEQSLDRGTVDPAERRRLAHSLGRPGAAHVSPIDMENAGKRDQPDYGESPGQLGAMSGGLDSAVTSPPYEASVNAKGHGIDWDKVGPDAGGRQRGENCQHGKTLRAQLSYGSDPDPDQLGTQEGETFWGAAREIVEQVYAALAPGGHAAWVTKAFVRDGERVDFPDQWRRLCEAVGFRTLHMHRCWLVEDHGVQLDLFGGEEPIVTQHKSFFRLLAERKGSPRVDYEVVWCMEKPGP